MEVTDLPLDILLYMSNYLKFRDFKNFVSSLPRNKENETLQRKLWSLSTHKIKTKFLNKKDLEIEYNFDPTRPKDDRLLISWDSMLPVLADLEPPKTFERFVSFPQLNNFIKCHIHMDQCSNRQHASCHCHRLGASSLAEVMRFKAIDTQCSYGHFHHYCNQHLGNWLNLFLRNLIIQQETGDLDEEASNQFLHVLGNTVCLVEERLQQLNLGRS